MRRECELLCHSSSHMPSMNATSYSNSKVRNLIFPMLRLLSSKAQGRKDFCKPSKPCNFGIHWIALAEYFLMSHFSISFSSFCIGKIRQHQHRD